MLPNKRRKQHNMQLGLYHLFNFGFALIFTILGILIYTVHMPRESEYNGYRKSRYTLGVGFVVMSLYCIFRLLIKQDMHSFFDFWILIEISLLFSWLNYTAFLYLIKTEHRIRHHFIVDGLMPLGLMTLLGIGGLIYPEAQEWISTLFGVIFIGKCAWMFYTCEREWHKVKNDLENNYDNSPNIVWMRRLVWLTLLLSVCTLMSWYIPALQMFYATSGPIVHTYMVLMMVNYDPRKICEMRDDNAPAEPTAAKPAPVSSNIVLQLEPKIQQWINDKRFCEANLTIKDVATEIGTNHSYLSRYLNNHLNVSFQVWLNTLRIEESKHLLATENISIEEVGARVGIPLSYNYSRWFKTIVGETPLKYRQHLNKAGDR